MIHDDWIDRLMGAILLLMLIAGVAVLIVATIWILTPKPTPFERFQTTIEKCVASELYTREQCVGFMTRK
jgi:hypothetical protein